MRLRLSPVLTLLLAVLILSFGLAPAQADPPAPVTGTVEIKTDSFKVGGHWYGYVATNPSYASRDSYQWLRDGDPIPGATGGTYTATAADLGYSLSLEVEVSAPGYSPATLESEEADPVEPPGQPGGGSGSGGDDELDTFDAYRPLILGKVRVGSTVQVETDPDDYDETTTLVYQWLINGEHVRKGTGTTFKLKKKLKGKLVSVRVTASEPGYETETVTSRPQKVKG